MQLAVTFRHMEATEALKSYATEKIDRITKYFPDPIKAHVVLSCERSYNHHADVTITLHNGILIKGEESTEDMYSSIDLVMAKIERQVRRYKDKIRHHRASPGEVEIFHSVFSVPVDGEPAHAPETKPAVEKPKVIKKSKFFARPLSVEEAVMQMNLLGNSFLVFKNAASKEVNVIYRRDDGTFGLIETSDAA